jgi:hypothetical protein
MRLIAHLPEPYHLGYHVLDKYPVAMCDVEFLYERTIVGMKWRLHAGSLSVLFFLMMTAEMQPEVFGGVKRSIA